MQKGGRSVRPVTRRFVRHLTQRVFIGLLTVVSLATMAACSSGSRDPLGQWYQHELGLIQGIASCSPDNYCMFVGQRTGHIALTQVYSFWERGAWSESRPMPSVGEVLQLSCGSRESCLAIRVDDATYGFGASAWNGYAWTKTASLPIGVAYSSCAGSNFCMVLDTDGRYGIWKPKSSSWSFGTMPGANDLSGLSCVSATFCMAIDLSGKTTVWTGDKWQSAGNAIAGFSIGTGPKGFSELHCSSNTWCLTLGPSDSQVGMWDGKRWKLASVPFPGVYSVSCISGPFCMAIGDSDKPYRWDGNKWIVTSGSYLPQGGQISCASSSYCIEAGWQGTAIFAIETPRFPY